MRKNNLGVFFGIFLVSILFVPPSMQFAEALDNSNFPIIGEDFPRLFIPDRLDTEWGGGSETLKEIGFTASGVSFEGLQQTYAPRDTTWATASVTIKIYEVASASQATDLRDEAYKKAVSTSEAQRAKHLNIGHDLDPAISNGCRGFAVAPEWAVVECAIDNYYYSIYAKETATSDRYVGVATGVVTNFANIVYVKLGGSGAFDQQVIQLQQLAETQGAETTTTPTPTLQETQQQTAAEQVESDGGCLIATAAYGSELTDEVQNLREIRNKMYETETGGELMKSVNEFYYSFSPTVSDWERENPILRESVKLLITPAMISFTVLDHEGINSDQDLINYVASITFLNIGMYFVAPAVLLSVCIRKINF